LKFIDGSAVSSCRTDGEVGTIALTIDHKTDIAMSKGGAVMVDGGGVAVTAGGRDSDALCDPPVSAVAQVSVEGDQSARFSDRVWRVYHMKCW
jgi:hypothetical protein